MRKAPNLREARIYQTKTNRLSGRYDGDSG